MARLSKSHHFKIFEDTGIPTPGPEGDDPFDAANTSPQDTFRDGRRSGYEEDFGAASRPAIEIPSDADDEAPRESLTSVSSFPESNAYHTDADDGRPYSPQKFSTPPMIRPSFRRPESVRRMQMSSPRQSILSYYRGSRLGTPRSVNGKGSPRGRRRITEESTSEEEEKQEEKTAHPLVLLHITLLPVVLSWSLESMHEILPAQVMENLQLLRSKVTETIAQRGVLISHPREEYEMLEERLLEALELKEERLTKCGHFRGRRSSDVKDVDLEGGSDSGLGSEASDDSEVCATCRHQILLSPSKAGKGKQKWSVKVFAANGLMRASAWAAAWSEMESVDVEVLPWISEEDKRKLDRRRDKEAEGREREEAEWAGARELAEAERSAIQEETMILAQSREDWRTPELGHEPELLVREPEVPMPEPKSDAKTREIRGQQVLPQVYRPSQIPLSILLKNYMSLLARDRRNVALFFLGIVVLFFALRPLTSARHEISPGNAQLDIPTREALSILPDSGLVNSPDMATSHVEEIAIQPVVDNVVALSGVADVRIEPESAFSRQHEPEIQTDEPTDRVEEELAVPQEVETREEHA